MTTGTNHDRLILLTTPIAALATHAIAPSATIPLAASYLIGGWFLSPDLDTPSKPFHRWRELKVLWLPYQKACKHCGSSHWLIIGTLGRVLYLAVPGLALAATAGIDLSPLLSHWQELAVVFLGLELSAWTHLAADGLLLK